MDVIVDLPIKFACFPPLPSFFLAPLKYLPLFNVQLSMLNTQHYNFFFA